METSSDAVAESDWLQLSEDESLQWTGRPSVLTLAPATIIVLLLVIVGILTTAWARDFVAAQGWPAALGLMPIGVAIIGLGIGLVEYLRWLRIRYAITDNECYVKIGLISRDVTHVSFDRVQNIAYTQSVWERLFSYGTVRVYTAGTNTDDLVFESVANPEQVTEVLTGRLDAGRQSS